MSVAQTSRLGWYARRLARMSPAEVPWRARDQVLRLAWARRQVRPGQLAAAAPLPPGQHRFAVTLPSGAAARVPEEARTAVLNSADRLLRGEWDVLGVSRTDLSGPTGSSTR